MKITNVSDTKFVILLIKFLKSNLIECNIMLSII